MAAAPGLPRRPRPYMGRRGDDTRRYTLAAPMSYGRPPTRAAIYCLLRPPDGWPAPRARLGAQDRRGCKRAVGLNAHARGGAFKRLNRGPERLARESFDALSLGRPRGRAGGCRNPGRGRSRGEGSDGGARAARASLVGGAVVPWRGAAADCIWPILNISAGYRGETQAARRRELTG